MPEQLNDAVATAIGSAFAKVVALPDGAESIVIGHDMRPSLARPGPGVRRAAPQRTALDVTLIGLCSTDGLYYASGALDLPGAMFTASHNPAQYNGIKLCRSPARPVGQDSGLAEVRDLAQWLLDTGAGSAAAGGGAGTVTSATCSATTRRSCAGWSTCPGRARSRSSSTPATAWAATPSRPCSADGGGLAGCRGCRWTSSRSTSSSTARSPTTRPTRWSRRTSRPAARRRRARRRHRARLRR